MSGAPERGPLHVWFVNEYAVPTVRSGGTRHHHLAQALAEHGVETTIIASDPRGPGAAGTERIDGATFLRLPHRQYRGNGGGRLLSMVAFAVRVVLAGWRPARHGVAAPDVIVGSSPHPFGALAAWMLARRHRCAFVLEIRDIWPLSLVAIAGVARRHPIVGLLGLVERFLYYRADEIVGLMDGLESHVADVAPRARARVTWIPNGTRLNRAPGRRRPAPGELFRVVYTGAHGVPNDLDTMLRAAAILEQRGGYRFEFYGEGVQKQAAVAFCRRQGLTSVTFHDPVPKSEVPDVIADSDLCIITWRNASVYRYGISPNKIFDYFGGARPVVMGTQLEDNIVVRSGGGYCVPAEDPEAFADAIEEIAKLDESERSAMGRRGWAYVQAHHDMQRLGRLYHEVIDRVSNSGGPGK